jgi:hypothetical protein
VAAETTDVAAQAGTHVTAEAAADMAAEATAYVTPSASAASRLCIGRKQAAGQQRARQYHYRLLLHNIILSVEPDLGPSEIPSSTDAGIDGSP